MSARAAILAALIVGVPAAHAQSSDSGIVDLVLSDPVFSGAASSPWLLPLLVVAGFVVIVVGIILLAWARGARLSDSERAFRLLASRVGINKKLREVVRKAAAEFGCAPVALLVSERALRDAILAYQSTPEGRARPQQLNDIERRLLSD